MDPLAPLRQLAASQHGVVSRDQSRILAIDPRVIRRRMASGELSPLSAEVLRFTGASDTPMARAMAGVLDVGPGAVVSHTSALGMWQVPGFSLDPVHALRPRGYRVRQPTLAIAHQSRRIPEHHLTVVDGVPVTTAGRALFDLAGSLHPLRLARAVDHAWGRRLTSADELFGLLDELGRRGRPGIGAMRSILEERGHDHVPGDSRLERDFFDDVVRHGQQPLERQVRLPTAIGALTVDGFDREAQLAVEIDGAAFHTASLDRLHDQRRDEALRAVGIEVLRFPEARLHHERWACLWELAERRAARRARPGDARAPWRRGLPYPSERSG